MAIEPILQAALKYPPASCLGLTVHVQCTLGYTIHYGTEANGLHVA